MSARGKTTARVFVKSVLLDLLSKQNQRALLSSGSLTELAPGPSQKHAIFATPNHVIKLHKDARKDGAHEALILKTITKADFSPHFIAHAKPKADANFGGLLVMERVKGKSPSQLNAKNAASIARAIYELHQIKAPKKCAQNAGMKNADELIEALPYLVDALPSAAQRREFGKRIAHEAKVMKALKLPKSKTRLIHGDLRLRNLLVSRNKTTLIDFETATLGDPAIDLALFIARDSLDDDAAFLLLEAYAFCAESIEVVRRTCALLPLVRLAGALGAWQKLAAFDEGAHPIFGDEKTWRKRAEKRAQEETRRALRDPPTPKKREAKRNVPLPFQTIEHLPKSTMADDDVALPDEDLPAFRKGRARVYEKTDGINVVVRPDHETLVHVKKKWARAAKGKMLLSVQAFAYLHEPYFRRVVPKGCALAFEWLRFSLSVRYVRLPHMALCISALDRDGYALSRTLAEGWVSEEKQAPPFAFSAPLFEGLLDENFDASRFVKRSLFGAQIMEGVIVERQEKGPLLAKWVRAGYRSPTPDDVDVTKLNRVKS